MEYYKEVFDNFVRENYAQIETLQKTIPKIDAYPCTILDSYGYIIPKDLSLITSLLELLPKAGVYVYALENFTLRDIDAPGGIVIPKEISYQDFLPTVNIYGWFLTKTPLQLTDEICRKYKFTNVYEGKGPTIELPIRYDILNNKSIAVYYNFYKDLSKLSETTEFIGLTSISFYLVLFTEKEIVFKINKFNKHNFERD